jgi:hypothetical protein
LLKPVQTLAEAMTCQKKRRLSGDFVLAVAGNGGLLRLRDYLNSMAEPQHSAAHMPQPLHFSRSITIRPPKGAFSSTM